MGKLKRSEFAPKNAKEIEMGSSWIPDEKCKKCGHILIEFIPDAPRVSGRTFTKCITCEETNGS